VFNFIFKLHNFHCFHPFYTFPVSTKPICEDVLAIGHLISPLVFIEVKVIQFSVFSVFQNCICYVFYSVCLEFCCFDDLVLQVNGCMKDVVPLANIYTNNQSCRDRLHKWVWLKLEMYKRGTMKIM
jgi:hypothetical protein